VLLLIATPLAAQALDTPRELRGTEIRQETVKWEWERTPGASRYQVVVNGRDQGTTSDTRFYSYDLKPGYHNMYLRAVDRRGNKSGRTLTARIRVSVKFKYGTHGRSVLVADSDAQNDAPSRPSSSGRLPAPANTRGTEVRPRELLWGWDKVAGAVEYEVTVDGKYAGKTRGNSWTSSNLWFGNHSMTVKSISSTGQLSYQSETSKIMVTGKASGSAGPTNDDPAPVPSPAPAPSNSGSSRFGTPQNTRGAEVRPRTVLWQWDAVAEANKYEVTVDGIYAGETRNTRWESGNLWRGDHSMTVKAVRRNGQKSEQSATVKLVVTGQASGGGTEDPAPAPPPPAPDGGNNGGDPDAENVQAFIDPASYGYSEVNNKPGYKLVFSDEFNGTGLNSYRWHSQLRWDGEWNGERYEYRTINGESQFYVNTLSPDPEHQEKIVPVYNPFKFNGNRLAIQARVNPLKDRNTNKTYGRMMDIARQQPFLSGVISTHRKFAQKYGYFEARIKIPDHVGTFPAFWLFHEKRASEGTQRTEIDIMENLGHAPKYIYNSFHYFKNVTPTYGGDANFVKPKPSGQINVGEDHAEDYHVYAVEWSPGRIKWFIDGKKVSELSNREVDFEELFLMINLAIGGNWTNFPTNAGGLGRPSNQRYPTSNDIRNFKNPSLEIDYVRVYKRK